MAERLLRVLTSLTGLLVLAGVNDALGERGVAGIGSAYAQPRVAKDEDYEDEDYASEDEAYDDSEDYAEESDEDSPEEASGGDTEDEEEEAEPDGSGKSGAAAQPVAGQPKSEAPTASGTQADGLSKEERIHTLLIHYTRQVLPYLGARAIQDSDSLEALGADSVDRREIIRLTWQSAGLIELSIPESELAEAENIGDMVRIMAAEMP